MGRKKKKNGVTTEKKTEIGGGIVDRIVSRRTFEPFDKPTVGCRFVRFRKRGEIIRGELGYPIRNYRQATSYPLELDSGEVVEIVGNKLLHKLIKKGDLYGKYVELHYLGREFLAAGHHRKIFRVFKVDRPPIFDAATLKKVLPKQKQ